MTDQEVWLKAWCAVAGAFNSKVADCDRYADACLQSFTARFPLSNRPDLSATDVGKFSARTMAQ